MTEHSSTEKAAGTTSSSGGIPVRFFPLGGGHLIVGTQLPIELRNAVRFEALWSLRAANTPSCREGRSKEPMPYCRQAFGVPENRQGNGPKQPSIPTCLHPLVDWCRAFSETDFNGVAVECQAVPSDYEAEPLRVNVRRLVPGSPIVTVSFGAPAMVRIVPFRRQSRCRALDVRIDDGELLIMPGHTNADFSRKIESVDPSDGRRISVTLMSLVASDVEPGLRNILKHLPSLTQDC